MHHGLSPRGRGNLVPVWDDVRVIGSIPAWAGEPGSGEDGPRLYKVYPRVGGGTPDGTPAECAAWGLSPRGRGNLDLLQFRLAVPRSIPAWAGEPSAGACFFRQQQVYPRVGGGTAHLHLDYVLLGGLSPRGRGNLQRPPGWRGRQGSIPAWAGEPPAGFKQPHEPRVYPRVGGGTRQRHII